MNIIGNFDDFADTFPPDLLPWVFRIIIEEWGHFFRTSRRPLENRITKPFVGHLQTCQDTRHLPFFFDLLVKIANPKKDTEEGELDIRVMHGKRPKVFFAFECKRLNVIREGEYASQAGAYVGMDGMGCFLFDNSDKDKKSKYDGGGNSAGMIGYVMDNDVKKALTAINKALKKNHKELKMKEPLELVLSSICDEKNHSCFETCHIYKTKGFTIYHIMLPYNLAQK